MNRDTTLDPLISEFETAEDEACYTTWLRAKVQKALDDPRPAIPQHQVMAQMDALIARIAAERQDC